MHTEMPPKKKRELKKAGDDRRKKDAHAAEQQESRARLQERAKTKETRADRAQVSGMSVLCSVAPHPARRHLLPRVF